MPTTTDCDAPLPEGPIDRTGLIGVVPARFGPKIVGGAEIAMRFMAQGLAARGWDVEVLTSCALDYFAWDNEVPPGLSVEDGLNVRRFPVVPPANPAERSDLGHRVLAGERLTLLEQQRWMNADIRIPELYHWILRNQERYRALLFGPYMFWPAFACSQISAERSVLLSCLHDEPYAYMELFESVFSGIAGILMLSEPEHQLAHRINSSLSPHAVVGCGVEVPESYDAEGFRARHGIDRPFLLYAGRREGAKGWDDLLSMFARAVRRRDLPFSLVTMGAGAVNAPADIADRVVDLGFLPDDERDNAFAAAAAYVQPSRYESFSRTIMESWLAHVPVVAFVESEVVRHHVERSRAGLLYADEYEFEEALCFLADAPQQARALGAAGRQYVLDNYQWDGVIGRIEACLSAWTKAPEAAAAGVA